MRRQPIRGRIVGLLFTDQACLASGFGPRVEPARCFSLGIQARMRFLGVRGRWLRTRRGSHVPEPCEAVMVKGSKAARARFSIGCTTSVACARRITLPAAGNRPRVLPSGRYEPARGETVLEGGLRSAIQ